jgi:cell division protein FtsL
VGRLAVILVAATAIAATLVHVRREQARVGHEIHACLSEQTTMRRELWNLRLEVERLLAPADVRTRAHQMALDLTDEEEARVRVARDADDSRVETTD